MSYLYRVIRNRSGGEAIGIACVPKNSVVLSIWHHSGGFVYDVPITKAEYSTYEAFSFPIYKWVVKSKATGFMMIWVVLYDPKYYTVRDGKVYENLS